MTKLAPGKNLNAKVLRCNIQNLQHSKTWRIFNDQKQNSSQLDGGSKTHIFQLGLKLPRRKSNCDPLSW